MSHHHPACSHHRTRNHATGMLARAFPVADRRAGSRLMAALGRVLSLPASVIVLVLAAALAPQAVARPDLLVADYKTGFNVNDDRIVRFDSVSGAFLGEFVPAGGPLDGPTDLVFGPNGDLYVTSIYLNAAPAPNIIQYDGQTGAFIRVLVPVSSGGLCAPAAIAFGPDQQLYVSSGCGGVVRKYDTATGNPLGIFIGHSTFASGGGVNAPRGILFGPDQRVYVAEYNSSEVRCFDLNGAPAAGFTTSGFGSTGAANGVALHDGRFYLALYGTDDVAVFNFNTHQFLSFIGVPPFSGGAPPPFGLFDGGPHSLAFGPDGLLYCSVHLDHTVVAIDPAQNEIVRRLDPLNAAGLDRPTGLAFVPEDTCYPDCNNSSSLTIADFGCFQAKFAAGDPYADCNGQGGLTIADFGCFQSQFAQGCP